MKQRFFIFMFFTLLISVADAQVFDKIGIGSGWFYSNQLWYYSSNTKLTVKNSYRQGIAINLFAEKKLDKLFSWRSEIGYLQRGFVRKLGNSFSTSEMTGYSRREYFGDVTFHDLVLNVEFKATPFNYDFNPYAIFGVQGSGILAVQNHFVDGLEYFYPGQFGGFHRVNLGNLIGVGLEVNNLAYLEILYNPIISDSFNMKDEGIRLRIREVGWHLKLGININKILKYKFVR